MFDMFTGKVAIITGGSEGIGLGIAKALAAQGAYVFLVGRTPSKLEIAENQILEDGGLVESRSGDITDVNVIMEIVDDVIKDKGQVDIFINNAGAWAQQGLETSFRDIWKSIELNMQAPFEITHCLINKFRKYEDKNLQILTVISQAALQGLNGCLGYGVAKTGLMSALLHLEQELQQEKISNIELLKLYPDTVATDKMIAMIGDNPMIDAVPVEQVASTALDLLLGKTLSKDVRIGYYPQKGIVRTFYSSNPKDVLTQTAIGEDIVDAKFTPKDIVIPEKEESY